MESYRKGDNPQESADVFAIDFTTLKYKMRNEQVATQYFENARIGR
jgi:hypothetical protein